jgi:hypothetical protein
MWLIDFLRRERRVSADGLPGQESSIGIPDGMHCAFALWQPDCQENGSIRTSYLYRLLILTYKS